MAKSEKPAVNKKQAVRDYVIAHPDASPKDVAAALKEQGIDVSPNTVSTVKWELKKDAAAKKSPAKKPAAETPEAKPAASPPPAPAAVVNKTQAVKQYLAAHRKASPKEVSLALQVQGIDVSPAYVSGIRFSMKPKKRKKAAAPVAVPAAAPVGSMTCAFRTRHACPNS